MTRKLPDDVVAAIRKARESGMSVTAIAAEFDIDPATVSKRCRGIPQPAGIGPGRRRSFDHAKAARLRASGLTMPTLSARFGVLESSLYRAIRKHTEALRLEAAE